MAQEATSFQGVHQGFVIGRMLRKTCCLLLLFFSLSRLRCCVATAPVVCGALCVSVPARLQPFYRSDRNPVKGVLGPVGLRKGFTVLVSEGLIKTGYLSYGFHIYQSRGQKADFITPGGFMMSNKAERGPSMWRQSTCCHEARVTIAGNVPPHRRRLHPDQIS